MKLENMLARSIGKTVYRDGDKCIKIFDSDYSKADVLHEALNHSRVEDLGINMPRILEIMMIDGKWSIIQDYIEGKTLARLMTEDPNRIGEYLDVFVNVQLDVLSHSAPLLNRLKDKMYDKIEHTELDACTRYELQARLSSMPKHLKLCHGDFNPSNVIISPDGTPFVIDWAHATQGNASADAARSYMLFKLDGKNELAERYLDLFCQKSNTEKIYVQKWLPIVAASQSVKKRPEEREMLLSWTNTVEYR